MIAATAMLVGCRDYDESYGNVDPVRVELAYAFSSSSAGSLTRMAEDKLQSDGAEINKLTVFQMHNQTIEPADISWKTPMKKPNETTPTSLYYHSNYCALNPGVNGCLVYGNVTLPTTVNTTDDIFFSLEPIHADANTLPEGAATVATYLTSIANAKGTYGSDELYWKNTTNYDLKYLFNYFTNNRKVLAGSAACARAWAQDLKTKLNALTINDPLLASVKTAIIEAIEDNSTISTCDYPRSAGLPDGAAVLRWNGTEFVTQTKTTTLAPINNITRYAKPAPLCYFVESGIQTSNSEVDYDDVYSNSSTWDDVLTNFTDDYEISSDTRAVAVTSPLEYAAARLKLTVKASDETLPDNDSESPNVTLADIFPITGIIVGDQRKVGYDFTPPLNQSDAEADIKFIYDHVPTKSGGNYNLTTTVTDPFETLVFQSPDEEEVTIILELQNNSGSAFKGNDGGIVHNGTRFYLLGKIKMENALDRGTEDYHKRVFTKDYTTEVQLTVSSFANAYNVLPNLLNYNLEIGVEVERQWTVAKPTEVHLD